jgi:hypothetical protein
VLKEREERGDDSNNNDKNGKKALHRKAPKTSKCGMSQQRIIDPAHAA